MDEHHRRPARRGRPSPRGRRAPARSGGRRRRRAATSGPATSSWRVGETSGARGARARATPAAAEVRVEGLVVGLAARRPPARSPAARGRCPRAGRSRSPRPRRAREHDRRAPAEGADLDDRAGRPRRAPRTPHSRRACASVSQPSITGRRRAHRAAAARRPGARPIASTDSAATACRPSTIAANVTSDSIPSPPSSTISASATARQRGQERDAPEREHVLHAEVADRQQRHRAARARTARRRRPRSPGPNASRSTVSGNSRVDDQHRHRDRAHHRQRARQHRPRVRARGAPRGSPRAADTGRSRSRPRRPPSRPPRRPRRHPASSPPIWRLTMITSTFWSTAIRNSADDRGPGAADEVEQPPRRARRRRRAEPRAR